MLTLPPLLAGEAELDLPNRREHAILQTGHGNRLTRAKPVITKTPSMLTLVYAVESPDAQ